MVVFSINVSALPAPDNYAFITISEELQKTYSVEGNEYTLMYRRYMPENWRKNKYPIVLVLHGAGERGDDNLFHATNAFLNHMVSTFKDEYPAILIAPQCPTDLWWSSDTLKAAMDLVDDAIKKYNGDPSRVYITGLSMGGMGSYEAAYEYTEKIAAIVPICGSPNWFNLDNGSAKSKMLIDMPLWAFHGDRDDVVSMDYEQTLIDQLHALGSDAKYTVYEGGRHDIWERAWCEDDLYPWLFSQTNKNMPLPDPKTPADNCWIIYAGILVVIVLISAAIIIIVKRGKKK